MSLSRQILRSYSQFQRALLSSQEALTLLPNHEQPTYQQYREFSASSQYIVKNDQIKTKIIQQSLVGNLGQQRSILNYLQSSKYCTAPDANREAHPSTQSSQQNDYQESNSSDNEVPGGTEEDYLKLTNLGLSNETIQALNARGITQLFPIQYYVYNPISQGRNVVGRAKTGSGKTLAFSLPLIEQVKQQHEQNPPRSGRPPTAIILEPTRELAKQVDAELNNSQQSGLVSTTIYGGMPLKPQIYSLRNGVDVVVGTPGRVLDLIARGVLQMGNISYIVLDECDLMLDMGFQNDIEDIIKHCGNSNKQLLMFSATLPAWVKSMARKFMDKPLLVDLVGDDQSGRLADNITPLAIQCSYLAKQQLLPDLIKVYSKQGRAIVFTQTKRAAGDVAARLSQYVECQAIHGDVPQSGRERVMSAFRSNSVRVLVATDVAARGIDVPDVDLVVHYDVPQSAEQYLHRSGRTGRAGKSGICLTLVSQNEEFEFRKIIQGVGVNIKMIGAPTAEDIRQASSADVFKKLADVPVDQAKQYANPAKKLLNAGNPVQVVATALAALSGPDTSLTQPRSLLSQEPGYVTLRADSSHGDDVSVRPLLKLLVKVCGDDVADGVKQVKSYYDDEVARTCSAFEVPEHVAEEIMAQAEQFTALGVSIDKPQSVPIQATFNVYDQGTFRGGDSRPRGKSYTRGYDSTRYGDGGYGGGGGTGEGGAGVDAGGMMTRG